MGRWGDVSLRIREKMKKLIQHHSLKGFTLVEVLLVVVIAMIAAGLAIPIFARSYQGAKLRTSARTITMLHRYARSISVLQQKQTALLYDTVVQRVELVSLESDGSAGIQLLNLDMLQRPSEENSISVVSEMTRQLPKGVRMVEVNSEKEDQEEEGLYWINYYPSGMCDKYRIRIEDKKGDTIRIDIDHISGSAEVEYD